jgi:hypothetical protein
MFEWRSIYCKQSLVLVELGENYWVAGDIVGRMLHIEDEYLASAEVSVVAAFACWMNGRRLVPPFSSWELCTLAGYTNNLTTQYSYC